MCNTSPRGLEWEKVKPTDVTDPHSTHDLLRNPSHKRICGSQNLLSFRSVVVFPIPL